MNKLPFCKQTVNTPLFLDSVQTDDCNTLKILIDEIQYNISKLMGELKKKDAYMYRRTLKEKANIWEDLPVTT